MSDTYDELDAGLAERDPDTSDMFAAPQAAAARTPPAAAPAYQVLARKYRPRTFEDLIGQEAMVRTLANAFASGRIAHAFMLTGVRGVGKTTTARLLARALNYESDTVRQPTLDLGQDGLHCRAIVEGRHLDVLELDAASRTKVDEMRELLDGVRYAPVEARYKVYVIDEVHMLSTAAFNALLKTLEEPPPHAKFIFATTEIRKVPVTILSRCQRFDLRRVEPDVLAPNLARICEAEGARIEPEALALIARAAEGSVRDGQSLLDQAIVQAERGEMVTTALVRDMLGLADRGQTLAVFEQLMRGQTGEALAGFRTLYGFGADPAQVVLDLLEHAHGASVAKVLGPDTLGLPSDQAGRLAAVGAKVSAGVLSRVWQMLLKAHEEVRRAPQPAAAAEMALIRLCYAADLPGPEEAMKLLQRGETPSLAPPPSASASPSGGVRAVAGGVARPDPMRAQPALADPALADPALVEPSLRPMAVPDASTLLQSFEDVVKLIDARRDVTLKLDVQKFVRLVDFKPTSDARPGVISFEPAPGAPANLSHRLSSRLREWTGQRWMMDLQVGGGESEGERQTREAAAEHARVAADPFVVAVMDAFPGSKIVDIRTAAAPAPEVGPGDEAPGDEAPGDEAPGDEALGDEALGDD